MENTRDFKGIWIDKVVWFDNRLNALDKFIFAEIDSLDSTDEGCYASNEYLANFCQCSPSKVSASIAKLIKYGYIYVKDFNGRMRYLKSRLTENRRQTSKIWKADSQNLEEIYINNNNICPSNDEQDNSSGELADNFDKIWSIYPRKEGKNASFNHYKSWLKGKKYAGRTVKLTNRQMWFATKKYADYILQHKVEKKYIKMGSTFFNEAIMEYVEVENG